MGPPLTIDGYCAVVYGPGWDQTKQGKKSKRDTVSEMCRKGTLNASKSGKRWLIWLEV